MQHIGRLYVLYINKAYRRTGTLWEGRHKASLVDAEAYLLTCYRYIEMNPVAAGMVESPEAYRWRSYRNNAWGKQNAVVSPHELYQALGNDADQRQHHYRELFRYMLPDEQIHEIREALTYNYPLGNDRFREQIEGMPGRAVGEKKEADRLNRKMVNIKSLRPL
jgi:putative transposase